jgi:NTP pyrophosphatase (non-canonical NTP hydrolase)
MIQEKENIVKKNESVKLPASLVANLKELDKLQAAIHAWRKDNFPTEGDTHQLLGAVEEVGELSRAHLKQRQQVRVNEDHWTNIKDAVGDIVIYLMGYCSYRHISLIDCVLAAWAEVEERDWRKNNGKINQAYKCSICGINEVDVDNGIDTCEDCLRRQ